MTVAPVKGYPSNYSYMGYMGGRYQEFVSDTEYHEELEESFDDILKNEQDKLKGGVKHE